MILNMDKFDWSYLNFDAFVIVLQLAAILAGAIMALIAACLLILLLALIVEGWVRRTF